MRTLEGVKRGFVVLRIIPAGKFLVWTGIDIDDQYFLPYRSLFYKYANDNNINFEFIENKDEYYLKYELFFLKNYDKYMSCAYKQNLFIKKTRRL